MTIDLDLLLKAYASGIFPMADARDDPDTFWVEPKARAIIPLDNFRMSRSLRKTIRSDRFQVTANAAFADVIDICATEAADRQETWINAEIEEAFNQLHQLGYAQSGFGLARGPPEGRGIQTARLPVHDRPSGVIGGC